MMDRQYLCKKIRIARKATGLTQEELCNDEGFSRFLHDIDAAGSILTERQLGYIEAGKLRNMKRIRNIISAFCNMLSISEALFYKTENDDEFGKIVKDAWESKYAFRSIVDKVKSEKEAILLESANTLYSELETDAHLTIVKELLDIAHELSKEYKSLPCSMKALSIYRIVIERGLFPDMFLESILKSIRFVANNCYEDINECPDQMDMRGKDDEANRRLCESLIRIISRYNTKFNFNRKIKLDELDLRRLYLLNKDEDLDVNSLKGASFKGSNIAYTVLHSIDLTDTSFDKLICAKNAWFVGSKTILKNASFEGANLIGVNLDFDYQNGQEFVDNGNFNELECGWPFLNAKSLANAKIDTWLKDFIDSYKRFRSKKEGY